MQRTFTLVTSKALSIDVMETHGTNQGSFSHVWAVSIRRKKQGFGDLNWNRLAAWALPCHNSTVCANV